MEKLIQEQRLHRVNLLQVLGGYPAPPVRRQYFDANKMLIRILDNFPKLDAMQYLKCTVEPPITVTSAQLLPPDLRSVKKVPAKFKVKLS